MLSVVQQDGVTLTDSAELAAAGRPTLTFTVARKGFLDANPGVVGKWLAATNDAIKLIKTDPATVAAAVSRQIGIGEADALAQLKQNIYLDHDEQRGPDCFGTPGAPGQLANRLRDTAEFLREQKKVEQVPDLATFQPHLGDLRWTAATRRHRPRTRRPSSVAADGRAVRRSRRPDQGAAAGGRAAAGP